jgi:putative spermidine/putrescine transport system ATP-binding protein
MSIQTRTPTTGTTHLQLRSLSKRFGDVVAVDDVDLEITSGEFLTLLGPSGSGKTTTLMMIAGFEDPTSGEILLEGSSLVGVPSYRRNFGMVFQNYALFPHMTVSDNIAFPLKMRRVSRSDRADMVRRVLELVRLPGHGHRFPNQLSGGQQQRIALARALVYNPPVLLMDEPLGALDKKLREDMQLEIKRIQSELNITTIYVTHDQEEALVLSDRIAVMNLGRLEQIDQPGALYERPTTRFVADFIGESNILPITVETRDGVAWGRVSSGDLLQLPPDAPAGGNYLVVRPEKLRFVSEESTGTTTLSGAIEEMIYAGDVTKYRLRVADDLMLTVKQQNRTGEIAGVPGDVRRVGWSVGDASVITDAAR